MSRLRELLYPQLTTFPEGEREAVLRRARAQPFDVIELVGIALGLVLATAATRYNIDEGEAAERVVAIALNLFIAIPLLAVLVGPFLVRRVRRALDEEISHRGPR